MKAVILAGGLGTRISEATHLRPKPMIEIGGKPILWHIMKIYSYHGINTFIICLGYKAYAVKEFFANYGLHTSDVSFDLARNHMEIHQNRVEPWHLSLIDTGEKTMTGGRLKRIADRLQEEEAFCLTYGDGVGDIDITRLIAFHRQRNTLATLTATYPPARFGELNIDREHKVREFREKSSQAMRMINGGFFVLSPKVLDLVQDDTTVWEHEPLETLAARGELSAYRHRGFWQPMDTLRDQVLLEDLWARGKAPWKVWQ